MDDVRGAVGIAGGGLQFLPSTSPHVRDMLIPNAKCMLRVMKLHRQLESLVKQGQQQGHQQGQLNRELRTEVMLFSYYARTCDPAVEYLQKYSKMGTDDIGRHMLKVSFEGFH